MSDTSLVAILLKDRETAQEARLECSRMASEHLLSLEDAVVVFKNEKGQVSLDQSVNLAAAGAMSGGFWGIFVGLLFSIPFGGAMLPLIAGAFGAGAGALSGALSEYGVSDELMRETGAALEENKAILFILGRSGAPDKVLERLSRFEGRVVKSNLPEELDRKINEVLGKATAAAA